MSVLIDANGFHVMVAYGRKCHIPIAQNGYFGAICGMGHPGSEKFFPASFFVAPWTKSRLRLINNAVLE